MRYYKDKNLSYYQTDSLVPPCCIEISEEEYNTAIAAIETENEAEEFNVPTYEELLIENQELERENASLLYQILTGEELADV